MKILDILPAYDTKQLTSSHIFVIFIFVIFPLNCQHTIVRKILDILPTNEQNQIYLNTNFMLKTINFSDEL